MRFLFSALVLLITFFSGCSMISINQTPRLIQLLPPPIDIEAKMDAAVTEERLTRGLGDKPSPPLRWWTRYQVGRLWSKADPARACAAFLAVSEEPGFPLAAVAKIRSLEVCPVDIHSLPSLDEVAATREPWLQELALRVTLKRAVLTQDQNTEMKLSFEVTKLRGVLQSEKIRLLKRAAELADTLKQPELHDKYLEMLYASAPRLNPNPKAETRLAIANDYRQAREFEKARAGYSLLTADASTADYDKYRALEGIRMSYKLEKKIEDYVLATRRLAAFTEKQFANKAKRAAWTEHFHDAHLLLARTLWTEDDATGARAVIAKMQAKLKGHFPLDESNWLKARIEEEAGHFDTAVQILEKIDGVHIVKKDLRPKIVWYKAWNLRRVGRFDEAVTNFSLAIKSDDNTFAQARAHYWLARTFSDLKQDDKAQAEYRALLESDPLGYYGLLAARDMKQDLAPLKAEDVSDKQLYRDTKAFARVEDSIYLEWLIALGEESIGQDFLDHVMASYRQAGVVTPERFRDLLRMYPRVGGYKSLFARVNELSPETRNEILKQYPSLLFPQPFQTEVREAAEKFSVEAELIYAVMRQESSFDAHARSPADAFGLMQVIPEVAREASAKSDLKYTTPEDLYEPDINIPVGASFLKMLEERHHDQFILTAASYNASDKAILGWVKTRSRKDPLEFIEDIPFEETRAYVKLVLRNYIFYKRFDSDGQPVAFPERCLENLQSANP